MNHEPPTEPGTPPSRSDHPALKKKSVWRFLREFTVLLVIAFVLALLIKTFLVQAFYIPSESMDPTLKPGDRVLVERVMTHPHRRWIVVFRNPHPTAEPDRGWFGGVVHWLSEGYGFSTPPDEDFIKRVLGLPGETIEIHRGGALYVDDRRIDEPYLNRVRDEQPFGPCTVPEDHVFVMGDNRTKSSDSRSDFGHGSSIEDGRCTGAISVGSIVGRAFVTMWPLSRLHWLA